MFARGGGRIRPSSASTRVAKDRFSNIVSAPTVIADVQAQRIGRLHENRIHVRGSIAATRLTVHKSSLYYARRATHALTPRRRHISLRLRRLGRRTVPVTLRIFRRLIL